MQGRRGDNEVVGQKEMSLLMERVKNRNKAEDGRVSEKTTGGRAGEIFRERKVRRDEESRT